MKSMDAGALNTQYFSETMIALQNNQPKQTIKRLDSKTGRQRSHLFDEKIAQPHFAIKCTCDTKASQCAIIA